MRRLCQRPHRRRIPPRDHGFSSRACEVTHRLTLTAHTTAVPVTRSDLSSGSQEVITSAKSPPGSWVPRLSLTPRRNTDSSHPCGKANPSFRLCFEQTRPVRFPALPLGRREPREAASLSADTAPGRPLSGPSTRPSLASATMA